MLLIITGSAFLLFQEHPFYIEGRNASRWKNSSDVGRERLRSHQLEGRRRRAETSGFRKESFALIQDLKIR